MPKTPSGSEWFGEVTQHLTFPKNVWKCLCMESMGSPAHKDTKRCLGSGLQGGICVSWQWPWCMCSKPGWLLSGMPESHRTFLCTVFLSASVQPSCLCPSPLFPRRKTARDATADLDTSQAQPRTPVRVCLLPAVNHRVTKPWVNVLLAPTKCVLALLVTNEPTLPYKLEHWIVTLCLKMGTKAPSMPSGLCVSAQASLK